jgi:penicillin-binding protein 1A
MREERFISEAQYQEAVSEPLLVAQRRHAADEQGGGGYFSEEVRRFIEEKYGVQRLYGAGLRVTTTLDPRIQAAAEDSIRGQLLALDHRRGWRGATLHLDKENLESLTLPSWRAGEPIVPGRLAPSSISAESAWHPGTFIMVFAANPGVRLPGGRHYFSPPAPGR